MYLETIYARFSFEFDGVVIRFSVCVLALSHVDYFQSATKLG